MKIVLQIMDIHLSVMYALYSYILTETNIKNL